MSRASIKQKIDSTIRKASVNEPVTRANLSNVLDDIVNLEGVSDIKYTKETGDILITFNDSTTLDIRIPHLDLIDDMVYDEVAKDIVLIRKDGTEMRISVKDLVDIYTGSIGTHIQITTENNVIKAVLRKGSVTEEELDAEFRDKISNIYNDATTANAKAGELESRMEDFEGVFSNLGNIVSSINMNGGNFLEIVRGLTKEGLHYLYGDYTGFNQNTNTATELFRGVFVNVNSGGGFPRNYMAFLIGGDIAYGRISETGNFSHAADFNGVRRFALGNHTHNSVGQSLIVSAHVTQNEANSLSIFENIGGFSSRFGSAHITFFAEGREWAERTDARKDLFLNGASTYIVIRTTFSNGQTLGYRVFGFAPSGKMYKALFHNDWAISPPQVIYHEDWTEIKNEEELPALHLSVTQIDNDTARATLTLSKKLPVDKDEEILWKNIYFTLNSEIVDSHENPQEGTFHYYLDFISYRFKDSGNMIQYWIDDGNGGKIMSNAVFFKKQESKLSPNITLTLSWHEDDLVVSASGRNMKYEHIEEDPNDKASYKAALCFEDRGVISVIEGLINFTGDDFDVRIPLRQRGHDYRHYTHGNLFVTIQNEDNGLFVGNVRSNFVRITDNDTLTVREYHLYNQFDSTKTLNEVANHLTGIVSNFTRYHTVRHPFITNPSITNVSSVEAQGAFAVQHIVSTDTFANHLLARSLVTNRVWVLSPFVSNNEWRLLSEDSASEDIEIGVWAASPIISILNKDGQFVVDPNFGVSNTVYVRRGSKVECNITCHFVPHTDDLISHVNFHVYGLPTFGRERALHNTRWEIVYFSPDEIVERSGSFNEFSNWEIFGRADNIQGISWLSQDGVLSINMKIDYTLTN